MKSMKKCISWIKENELPWFFSVIKLLAEGKYISINSGAFLMILAAQRAAFFLMYVFDDFISRSISPAKSLLISGEQIEPKQQSAKPTTNCVWLFKSLQKKSSQWISIIKWKIIDTF